MGPPGGPCMAGPPRPMGPGPMAGPPGPPQPNGAFRPAGPPQPGQGPVNGLTPGGDMNGVNGRHSPNFPPTMKPPVNGHAPGPGSQAPLPPAPGGPLPPQSMRGPLPPQSMGGPLP